MAFLSGLEAINYQINSPFAKEMITIFQDTIDYRQKIKQKTSTATEVVDAVEKYFFKVTGQKLAACIKKHSGIPVKHIYVSERFSMCYACCVDFGSDEGLNMYTTIQRYSGIEISDIEKEMYNITSSNTFSSAELEKLSNKFNIKTGKMDLTKLAGKDISLLLYFDYNSAFLAQETGHVLCEPMTAEEITAIVLHEVGHMLTMFEHASEAYFKSVFYSNVSYNTVKKIANKFDAILYGLDYLSYKFPSKKDNLNALRLKVESHKKTYLSNSANTIPVFITLLYSAILLIFFAHCSICMIPVELLIKIFTPLGVEIDAMFLNGDYYALRKQYKYCEQLADEYVSRHGLSSSLITALSKIFKWCEITALGYIDHNSALAWNVSKIVFIATTLFFGDHTDGGGDYDRQYDRATRSMNNLIGIFKNSNLSKSALDFYIKDYENCRIAIDKYKKGSRAVEIIHTIHLILDYICGTPLESMMSGKFFREYNNLYEKAEYLTTNSLFFHQAKLRQLKDTIPNKESK